MEGSVLPLPLLLLWFRTCPKDIHEVDENSHFSVEKTLCTTDYFSGPYSADGFLEGGADTCREHSDISSSGFSINRKKPVLEPCQNIQFLGMESTQ